MVLTNTQKQLINEAVSTMPYLDVLLLKTGSATALSNLACQELGAGCSDFDGYVTRAAQDLLFHNNKNL